MEGVSIVSVRGKDVQHGKVSMAVDLFDFLFNGSRLNAVEVQTVSAGK